MLTVTERAKQQLKQILSNSVGEPDVALRMSPSGPGEFGLALDKEKEGDQVVEHEGSRVLLVGSEVADLLEGWTIDCRETAEGPLLVFSK